MDDRLDLIADVLEGDWLADFAGEGLSALEEYLSKQAAFRAYLVERADDNRAIRP